MQLEVNSTARSLYLVVVFGISVYAIRKADALHSPNECFLGSRSIGQCAGDDAHRDLYRAISFIGEPGAAYN
ncbi:hypothetical protein ACNKHL_19845 [Shigella flexneri]